MQIPRSTLHSRRKQIAINKNIIHENDEVSENINDIEASKNIAELSQPSDHSDIEASNEDNMSRPRKKYRLWKDDPKKTVCLKSQVYIYLSYMYNCI